MISYVILYFLIRGVEKDFLPYRNTLNCKGISFEKNMYIDSHYIEKDSEYSPRYLAVFFLFFIISLNFLTWKGMKNDPYITYRPTLIVLSVTIRFCCWC